MTFTLDWSTADIDGQNTVTDGDDTIAVNVSTPAVGPYTWRLATRDGYEGLFSNQGPGLRHVDMAFGAAIENVSFEIFDVDSGENDGNPVNWDDRVTVIALDADGNQVPVVFSDTSSTHVVDGNSVEGEGNANPNVEASGAADSVSVNIAGPIVSLTIIHTSGDATDFLGVVGLSDLSFDAAAIVPDGIVEGLAGDDFIDDDYEDDPEGDKIDAGDAILPGEDKDDDIVEAGTGDDTVLAGKGDDEVFGGAGSDSLDGGDDADVLVGDGTFGTGATAPITITIDEVNAGLTSEVFAYVIDPATGDLLQIEALSTDAASDEGTSFVFDARIGATIGVGIKNSEGTFVSSGFGDFADLNPDGQLHTTGISQAPDGAVTLGFEGLLGGGDGDFNDVILTVDLGNSGTVFDNAHFAYESAPGELPVSEGADTLIGGRGNDVAFGQGGDDSIDGGRGRDTLFGGDGDDTIDGEGNEDSISGGGGDDLVDGGRGSDTLDGGDGDDTVLGNNGNDFVYGGDGGDSLDGGRGRDTVLGGDGNDTIIGGTGPDLLSGGGDRDLIFANDGDTVDGGSGGDDFDTLDLTGQGPFRLEDLEADENGNGFNGTVIYLDGTGTPTGLTLTFTEVEEVRGDNVGSSAPIANDDTATLDEDTSVDIAVLNNDIDPDGDPLTITAASSPDGTVTINPDGTLTFEPNENFNGDTTITYTVEDPDGNEATATVDVSVAPVNDDPVAEDDILAVPEDGTATIAVLDNDTDVDGDPLTVISATSPDGDVTINADGTLDFAPDPGFSGATTIEYTISDGNGGMDSATVSVQVVPVDGSPTLGNDFATTDEDTLVTIDVLDNDVDPQGDPLTVTSATSPDGTVTINPDGTLDFTPALNFNGNTTITYTAEDPDGNESTATVFVTVDPVNDAPDAVDDTATTPFETDVTVDVLDNDTDVDGDLLTVVSATSAQGTVTINGDGTLSFSPNPGFEGDATISYTVEDPGGLQDTATLTVTVEDEPLDGIVQGTSGDDTIDASYTDDPQGDSVDAGDAILPGEGPDDDIIQAGDGNDTVEAGAGDDEVDGGADNDSLSGGAGNDSIEGGTGNDTLSGDAGDDTLLGGADDDTFENLNQGDSVDGGSTGTDFDTLDLTGSTEPGGSLQVTISGPDSDGNGQDGFVTYFDTDGVATGTLDFTNIESIVPCFTPGTLIATPKGECRVEALEVGDLVITRDHGLQEIRWTGRREMTPAELRDAPHLRPVRIARGALGQGLPERNMLVSPNHRVLIASHKTELFFEEREVLVAAKHLVGMDGVTWAEVHKASYIHIMFDRHEVILSDGAWTESFQPGDLSLAGVENAQREELLELFPELGTRTGVDAYAAARRTLRKHEAAILR